MDMAAFVVPKSDQLNADDLIAGPRTITVARVTGTGNADQPVAVYFDGDGGKPYKPCKSMRRVMIAAWGVDAAQYVGRSMTLYRDAKVAFGGMEVGGIRISHMSHIERDMVMALTVTKARRAPYQVKRLVPATQAKPTLRDMIRQAAAAAQTEADVAAIEARQDYTTALAKASQEIADELRAIIKEARERVAAHSEGVPL